MKDKNQHKVTKDMLRKESFYIRAKLANKMKKSDSRLRATQKVRDMVLDLNHEAVKGHKPYILTTIWSPSEILYALDIIPICVESTAVGLAGFGLSDEYLGIAEKNFHTPETCSILRCGVGAVIDKLFPQPSAVIAATHLCDAGAKVNSVASRVYDCPYFLIDIPQERGEEAVSYVAKQLEEMAHGLSDITGRKLNIQKLTQAIELSNQARIYALRVNELRQAVPSPMRGSEALGYLYVVGLGFGSKTAVNIYRSMASELEKRVEKKFSPIGEEKHRLLWLHVRPYFKNRLFHYLEKDQKAAIAFEEINHIYWDELDPEQPFKSVAQRLVLNSANGPIDNYTDILIDLAQKYKVDGVLHYAHWGCRWNYGRLRVIKDAFQKKGIPFVSIDCDSASSQNYFEGQLNSRIDTFLDMLD
jgi:benzoyl-CoA reductase/2-hydroxyglutaryl-CoA dehydratase subunit BcrC/BadD/HgdB